MPTPPVCGGHRVLAYGPGPFLTSDRVQHPTPPSLPEPFRNTPSGNGGSSILWTDQGKPWCLSWRLTPWDGDVFGGLRPFPGFLFILPLYSPGTTMASTGFEAHQSEKLGPLTQDVEVDKGVPVNAMPASPSSSVSMKLGSDNTHRRLKSRHIQLIGIGG